MGNALNANRDPEHRCPKFLFLKSPNTRNHNMYNASGSPAPKASSVQLLETALKDWPLYPFADFVLDRCTGLGTHHIFAQYFPLLPISQRRLFFGLRCGRL